MAEIPLRSSIDAYSDDMDMLWLAATQSDIAQLATRYMLITLQDEKASNVEHIEMVKKLMTLYYRTTIAFCENAIVSCNEFGSPKTKTKTCEYLQQVSNYMAAYLYLMTNCKVVPIVEYVGLSDTVLRDEWLKDYEQRSDNSFPQNVRGNTIGNIANGGCVAQSGDWIYFEHTNDGFKLYKMRVDGSEKAKLNDDVSYCINVVDDWIYYINNQEGDQVIYKIHTDGSEKTKLNDSMSEDINVLGDWIYYKKYCGNGDWMLHKLRTDGSEEIMLYDKTIFDFCVTDNWIYFTAYEGDGNYGLCKIRTDGSEMTKLNDEKACDLNCEGDWIYYTVGGLEDRYIRKIYSDGSGETRVNSDGCLYFNVTGDWIYYSNWNDNGRLYKIRTDGTQKTKISDDRCFQINIIDEWIYYTIDIDGYLYRIYSDGTKQQKITG